MNQSFVKTTRLVAENGLYLPTATTGGGGGGITQLTGDVLAGPAVGSTLATVVRINGATVPVAGALTPGNVLTVTGVAALAYLPPATTGITQLTGDVLAGPGTGSLPATVVRINGATVPVAGALTPGDVLTVTGVSALGYAPPATTGITQLTGDVLAGPGVGSLPATVVRINGATVPVAGALTPGYVLTVTGAASLAYAPPVSAPDLIQKVVNGPIVVTTTTTNVTGEFVGLTTDQTGTLPVAPATGQRVEFKDGDGSLAFFNFTISAGANTIDNDGTTYEMTNTKNGPKGHLRLRYDGAGNWMIV